MTPQAFIQKWQIATLKERSAAHEHFLNLCALLEEPTPADADPTGTWYSFEKGAKKTGGGEGWADVWKRHCFAWEYKGKHHDLNAALRQLQQYALALENPPLLIVSDLDTIVIHTNFTNTVHQVHTLPLESLADPAQLRLLKWAFSEPERLRPDRTTAAVTAEAAEAFASLAQRLRERGHEPQRVAHFITKLLFCMFAEDIGILPRDLFQRLLTAGLRNPAQFEAMAQGLFTAMTRGGFFGVESIPWFNGGLFNDDEVLPLDVEDLKIAHRAAQLDWSVIEPAIFGTLFERGLDPDKRSQLGAHYTDKGSILRLIDPVIRDPLLAEWTQVKQTIQQDLDKAGQAKSAMANTKARHQAEQALQGFLERLRTFRVLDPACGSGNFLYVALQTLKDLEHRVMLEAEALGLQRGFPAVGPEAVLGIEINPYAAELARVTVWIGEIQWMLTHGYNLNMNPVLRPLDQIECRDALLNPDGSEAAWPAVDAMVGNPPFLGDKKMLGELGEEYVATLRRIYRGRVPGGADLVTYWFEKGRAQITAGQSQRAGLVATNVISKKRNRPILERIRNCGEIFNAWSDQPWVNEGAAVRVSLVCFGARASTQPVILDGKPAAVIHADLTAGGDTGVDLTRARPLPENAGGSFFGLCLAGAFAVNGDIARRWLKLPNPHGRPNAEVLRPIYNGADVLKGHKDRWVIDFGPAMSETEAALYEAPFRYVEEHVKSVRLVNNRKARAINWWRHGEARPGMRRALKGLSRYIATVETAKHRIFVWFDMAVAPEHNLIVIVRDDDEIFGVLSSRFHVVWVNATGAPYGNHPTARRYNSTMVFETFPFPEGLTPNITASDYANDPRAQAIAKAARRLVELRDNWLNPPEWVQRVPEVVPGYPDRLLPVDEKAAQELKKRTLTNLYNQRPAWLVNAHRALDEAVAAAYGWPADLSNDEILRRLLALNLERVGASA